MLAPKLCCALTVPTPAQASSLPRVLPLPSVSNQLSLALGFIRGLRKLGFSLEFIKMEWSLPPSCCRHKAWAPCPHLVATTPCPSAGCLWALSQEAPRRKLGGKPPCCVLQERREEWLTEAVCKQKPGLCCQMDAEGAE